MDTHGLQKLAILALIQHVVDTPEGRDVSDDADRLAGLIYHPDEVARLLDDAEFCMVGPNAHLPGPCPSPDSPSNHSPTSLGRAVLRRAIASFKAVGHGAGHIEHVVKDFLAAGVDEQIARLPKNTGKAVSALWWATKLGAKAAFSTYLAGQNMAQDVAKLAGATPEQSLRLRAICTALDLVGAKAVPLTLASVGLGAVALPGSFIPIGSAAYLAYSTARRPLAVLRAAKSAIARLAAAPRVTEFAADTVGLQVLMERIKGDDTGRYDALLCAALEHAETLEEAVALADEAAEEGTAGFAAHHAPVGGVSIQGKRYPGGEFIPVEVMAQATAKEKQAVAGQPAKPEKGKAPKARAVLDPSKMGAARKEGKGRDAKIVMEDGSPAPAHVKPGMVRGDWLDVKVSLDPDSDFVVAAREKDNEDGTPGVAVTVYSESWDMRQAATKFARTREGLLARGQMDAEVQRDRADPKKKDKADCVWLMREQGTRPGSEKDNKGVSRLFGRSMTPESIVVEGEGKKQKVTLSLDPDDEVLVKDTKTKAELLRRKEAGEPLHDSTFWLKSHGATTLEGRHVIEAPDGVRIQFVAKESVYHDHRIRDPELAKMLLGRKAKAGERGQLFPVSEGQVASYSETLDGGKFTPKDWRTQRGTREAIDAVNGMEAPKDEESYRRAVMEVAEVVSSLLGNAPDVALEKYVDPTVFAAWRGGIV